MRLWISLVTFLVLLLCDKSAGRDHDPVPTCAENNVCLVFSNIYCDVGGVRWQDVDRTNFQGYVWRKINDPVCQKKPDYFGLSAKLDFEPINRTHWKIYATLHEKEDSVQVNVPEDFTFKFGTKAELKFFQNSTKFLWQRSKASSKEEEGSLAKEGFLESWDQFWILWYNTAVSGFAKYASTIGTKGEKLLDIIGPEVTLHLKDRKFVLNDIAFPEGLSRLTKCDATEIKEVCYDTCDKIFPDANSNANATNSSSALDPDSIPNCASHLWVSSPSETGFFRKWKKVEKLDCYMAWWRAKWTEWDGDATKGTKNILPSDEVQCSIMKPSKMTTIAKIVIGIGAGIGGLLLLAGVVALFWFLNKRNRRHRHHGHTEKKFTLRDSDSKSRAQTPGGKSTEREKF